MVELKEKIKQKDRTLTTLIQKISKSEIQFIRKYN